MSDADNTAPSLTQEELRRLEERERARISDPNYRGILQDPTAVITALVRHHGDS